MLWVLHMSARARFPWQMNVSSRYGAPMGRRSYPKELSGRLRLQRVVLRGDYDQGGAYWGAGGGPLWCAWNECAVMYLRAPTREAAMAEVRAQAGDTVSFRGEGRVWRRE